MSILDRILPPQVDNRYRGHPVGLWLFVPIALIKLSQSLTHLLKHDGGAQSISTIPLDTYPVSAAQNVSGKIVAQAKPLLLAGTPGVSTPFLVVAILSFIGLILSLIGRGYAPSRDTTPQDS